MFAGRTGYLVFITRQRVSWHFLWCDDKNNEIFISPSQTTRARERWREAEKNVFHSNELTIVGRWQRTLARTVEEIEMKIFEIKISRTLHWNLITRSWKLSSFQTLITRFQQLMLRIISLLLTLWLVWCWSVFAFLTSLFSPVVLASHTKQCTEVSTFNSFIIKSPQGSLALRRDWEFSTLKLCVSCARFGDRHSHTCWREWCSGEVGKGAAKATDGWKWKRKREIKWKRIASRIVKKWGKFFFYGTGNSSLGRCCRLTNSSNGNVGFFGVARWWCEEQ